jgi:YVTN family beta-propeller protein
MPRSSLSRVRPFVVVAVLGASVLGVLGAQSDERPRSRSMQADFHRLDILREMARRQADQSAESPVAQDRPADRGAEFAFGLAFGTASSFVNFESPHVHPLELTPDGTRLLAVNTADNRLEVFDVSGAQPVGIASIPVGLEPVSVRARTNGEAWVVNLVSDSVSIVNLVNASVSATITVGDEPCDVVFAGTPSRAFVSLSALNQIKVYDPTNLAAAPIVVALQGEDPRALATDGTQVYAAIAESGNGSTIISQQVVSSSVNPYPGDQNPPPNAGTTFSPAQKPGNPPPPAVSLIVKKDAGGVWRDDNNGNWNAAVTWGVPDRDVAIINAQTLGVSYAGGLMNLVMGIAMGPGGSVTIVGTEAINQRRFEPNVNGIFVRSMLGRFQPATPGTVTVTDLNPHLTYATPTVSQAQRDLSLGDPRQIAWNAAGTTGFVAGMGSNNVLVIDGVGAPITRIEVGAGPTGLAMRESAGVLYVLNRFDATVSAVSVAGLSVSATVPFFDPTPAVVRDGRPFLYDTHRTSGLGQASCGSCHIDGRMDQLAWDLGDPSGNVKLFDQVCNFGVGGCENWHPMKGPMTTQTLFGIFGVGPLHWRGDRSNLSQFNPAFEGLLGDDVQLTPQEMAAFEAFLGTLTFPPNPNRNINDSLKTTFSNGGNPANGQTLYTNLPVDGGVLTCNACHSLPTGTNGQLTSGPLLQETQSIKIPQLRNMYEKTGLVKTPAGGTRGFGFIHDGSTANLFEFLSLPVFNFAGGGTGQQQRRDIEAFLFSFPTGTHAGVGVQSTLVSVSLAQPSQIALLDQMQTIAASGAVDLVAKGTVAGLARGWVLTSGTSWQSDRAAESVTSTQLRALAAIGSELTFTMVPAGSGTRIGIDRDLDGYFDRDELDAGSDPADPNSVPGACAGDFNNDGIVDGADLATMLGQWGQTGSGDLDNSGTVDAADLALFLGDWGCEG